MNKNIQLRNSIQTGIEKIRGFIQNSLIARKPCKLLSVSFTDKYFLLEEDSFEEYLDITNTQLQNLYKIDLFNGCILPVLPALIQSLNGHFSSEKKQISVKHVTTEEPTNEMGSVLTFLFKRSLIYPIPPYKIEKKTPSLSLHKQHKEQNFRTISIKGSSGKKVRFHLDIFKEHAGAPLNSKLVLYKQIRKAYGKKAINKLNLSKDLSRDLLLVFGEYLVLEGTAFEKALTEKLSNNEIELEDLSSLFKFAFKYGIEPLMHVCINVFSLFAKKDNIVKIADLSSIYKNEKLAALVEHLKGEMGERKST